MEQGMEQEIENEEFTVRVVWLMYCLFNLDKTACITEDLLQMVMRINTRSDTRLQPAFFASLIQNPYTLTGLNAVVKFEDVRVNRGQGYNPSTGVFTSPRKGLYHISCLILGARGNAVQYQLNKNDAVYTYGYSSKGAQSSTISSLVEMKKGDRVFIKHRVSGSPQIYGYFMQE